MKQQEFEQLINRIEENDPTLDILCLYGRNISNAEIRALAEALKTNQTVTTINLADNNLHDAEIEELAKVLEHNQTITTVSLRINNITKVGAKALARMLEQNQTITEINLDNNYIGSIGTKTLAKMLEQNQTITEISLTFNNIKDVGAIELAKALKINKTVTVINLNDNRIGSPGANALAEMLAQNQTILSIYGFCRFNSFEELIDKNKNLLIERCKKILADEKISTVELLIINTQFKCDERYLPDYVKDNFDKLNTAIKSIIKTLIIEKLSETIAIMPRDLLNIISNYVDNDIKPDIHNKSDLKNIEFFDNNVKTPSFADKFGGKGKDAPKNERGL